MRTSVVLPAPFGPRRPKTIPSGTSRSTPASAVVEPNRLTTPAALTADGPARRDPLVSGCLIAAVGALLVVREVSRDRISSTYPTSGQRDLGWPPCWTAPC